MQISGQSFDEIARRIRAEFREMPGLVLTKAQAQRLWRLDASECEHALAALVSEGFLRFTGQAYFRPSAAR